MPKYEVISFLSDMGTVDESVGVCKAIIFQQAPNVNIFDITHDVPQFDVRAGALALTRAIQFLPNGIVIAAVDPGSPRDQRYIAVEMETGVLIGPDNGILAPAAQLIGEPKRVVEISNPEFRIEAPGAVFAARDILAPAAGVLAAGTDLGELGRPIPMEELVPGMLQLSRHDQGGAFLGEIWSIDRFGNIQLNITPEELESANVKLGDTVAVRISGNDFMAKFVERYADLGVGQLGILVDSTGMVSVVKNLDFAARELEAKDGKEVIILPQGATLTGIDVEVESYTQRDDQLAGTPPESAPQMPPVYEQNPGSGVPGVQPVIAPGQPMDPFVTTTAQPQTPVDPFASPQIPQMPPAQSAAPQSGARPDYVPAPNIAPPVQPQPPQAPVDPFATPVQNPGQPPLAPQAPVDPFATPVQTPVPPTDPGPPIDSANYFPPPPAQAPVVEPQATPNYDKSNPAGGTDPGQGVPPQGLPMNVFDLFKGDEEGEGNSSDPNQHPTQQ